MSATVTVTGPTRARRSSERGAALVFALLGLATLTILGLGLTGLGMVGTKMTINERDTQEALALADAGLAHARKLITYKEWDWLNLSPFLTSGNGTACDGDELSQAPTVPVGAMPLPNPGYPTLFIGAAAGGGTALGTGTYRVFVCDDDPTDWDNTVTPAVINANPIVDANRRIIVRSVGTTASGATATLEQVMGANAVPAVLVNGNVLAGGNVQVMGANGTIHSNGSMDIIGSSVCAQQQFEATGDVTGNPDGGPSCDEPGEKRPGSAPVNVRVLTPIQFKQHAQYWLSVQLGGPGGASALLRTYNAGTATWSAPVTAPAWAQAHASSYSITLDPTAPKTIYYSDANIQVGSNFLSECDPAVPPMGYVSTEVTILTEGWFDADGGAKLCGKYKQLGLGRVTVIAGTDIELGGNTGGSLPDPPPPMLGGLYYARHQIGTTGTPIIYGQVVALNLADTNYPASGTGSTNPVQLDAQGRMRFNGNGYINYSEGGMTTTAPLSWRECRPDAASLDPDPCGVHYGGPN